MHSRGAIGAIIAASLMAMPAVASIEPEKRAKPKAKPTKPELPPGPVTRQQRRAAERAAHKQVPA